MDQPKKKSPHDDCGSRLKDNLVEFAEKQKSDERVHSHINANNTQLVSNR
uniref:Uncharacterized protein n=1 Tax=Arion vulgaris TaxID=1028688 RepID=A0A0B6ZR60_9EUPU